MRREWVLVCAMGCAGDMPGGEGAAPRSEAGQVPETVTVSGVVTDGVEPVQGAIVRFGGRSEHVETDSAGSFSLPVDESTLDLDNSALTAGAPGFFSRGVAVTDLSVGHEIALDRIELVDNPDYEYKAPDTLDATPFCLHCHKEQVFEWRDSAHAESAKDPFLHDVYNGTALGFNDEASCVNAGGEWRVGKGGAEKCYVGIPVLADLNPAICGGAGQPTCDSDGLDVPNPGPCADCHAPASAPHIPGATNVNDVSGIGYDAGVHCDFCHKIANVNVNDKPGMFGAIEVLRPGPPFIGGFSNPEIMFGPYDDVIMPVMGGTPQPQFLTSELCSGCHQWSEAGMRVGDAAHVDANKWPDGIPIQDTYYEWSKSPQAMQGLHCQNCHMPALDVETSAGNLVLPPGTEGIFGYPREYGKVRSHAFQARLAADPSHIPGPGDPTREALRNPIDVSISANSEDGEVRVQVSLSNTGAGHSIPTGTPSRAMLMVVEATTEAGQRLDAIDGHTVPLWTGAVAQGTIATNLAGATEIVGEFPGVAGGDVLRVVRGTGEFDDYPSTRWFAELERTAEEKGMEVFEPIAEVEIAQVLPDRVVLAKPVTAPAGARFAVGRRVPDASVDDELSLTPLAGAAGYAFGKVLSDRDGTVNVPFWRSVNVVSDNRIPAGKTATTTHVFDGSGAAGKDVVIKVTVLYRKHPWGESRRRGWTVVDVVRLTKTAVVAADGPH